MPTRRLTREDVVRLGQSGGPWEFLPVGGAALRAAPGDDGVRFLVSAALGRLGLRTLAIEQLGLVRAADPAVEQLRRVLHDLPGDELSASQRRAWVAGNLDALGSRGADLLPFAGRWSERVEGTQAYRSLDGNVVRRASGSPNPIEWVHVGDHAGAAARFVGEQIAKRPAPMPPITMEGLDPPWLLAAIARATAADATGYQARLAVIQADPLEALDGLSLCDLRAVLADERVMVLAGRDAAARFGAWARENLGKRLSGPFVPLSTLRSRCEPGVASVVQGVMQEQDARAGELRRAIAARASARGASWIASRWGPGATERVRVLIPTCRYTTFLQHAGRDLAEAFGRLGCACEVIMEPDGHSQMSSVAYLEALERVDPDLVVLINYSRAQLGGVMPPEVPVVTWIQDMMPHLFTPESGAGQGPLDFVAGHCGEDLFTRYGYARDRAVASPVVASESKFHPGLVTGAQRSRFGCQIACVTHHSETVEAMHARLVRESAADPDAPRLLEALLPVCRDVAARAHDLNPWSVLRGEVSRAMARVHRLAGNPDVEGAVLRSYAIPVADRAFRHLAIEWAARICARRGWTLRLFGRGWERHPTLGAFAAGLTEHGEDLRACYQCASVHLHLCLATLMHQRPIECVLSGGLPVMRPTRDALAGLHARAQMRLVDEGIEPVEADASTGESLYSFADTPEGMRYASMAARLGMAPKRRGVSLTPARLDALRRRRALEPIETDPTWLYGDLPEICFADEHGLERLVERAIGCPDWRAAVTGGIASRARERLTHTALARRVLRSVGERVARETGPPGGFGDPRADERPVHAGTG